MPSKPRSKKKSAPKMSYKAMSGTANLVALATCNILPPKVFGYQDRS